MDGELGTRDVSDCAYASRMTRRTGGLPRKMDGTRLAGPENQMRDVVEREDLPYPD